MDTMLYVALSHQTALRHQMDVVANNIANLNTTGYRRQSILFQQYVTEMEGTMTPAAKSVTFVQDFGVYRHEGAGDLVMTGNPLDVAISGPGYFMVESEDGDTFFTRNGSMQLNEEGYLVTSSGEQFIGTNDDPILIGPQDTDISIARDGTISSAAGQVGVLAFFEFENVQLLRKVRDSLHRTDADPLPPEKTSIIHRTIESSNVNGVLEMTRMIQVLRSYQSVAKTMGDYEELRRKAINQLGRLS